MEKITAILTGLELGEGCVWNEKRNCVHFLDITKFKIYTYNLENKHISEICMENYVGCIVLDSNGNLIAGVKNKIVSVDIDTGLKETLCTVKQEDFLRFNDGKCDVHGNLWVGSMPINVTEKNHGTGKLYCIKNNNVVATYPNFTIPNGLAWDENSNVFYHIETTKKQIYSYKIENEFILKNKNIAVEVSNENGGPDGMCIDSNGNLWVAIWGGSKVCCYSTAKGKKLKEIYFPEKNISCCTFGGKDLDILFVTAAKSDNSLGGFYKLKIEDTHGVKPYIFK